MQFTPKGIELDSIVSSIEEEPEIKNAHHLHVWKLDDNHIHLEAHLDFLDDVVLSVSNRVMDRLEKKLHDSFDIEHTTFQCEYERDDNKEIVN